MPAPIDPTADGSPAVQNFEPARRHVGAGPDSDGDGLSDDFEANVFGSDPIARDGDGHGLNDWAEYWLDTKPKDNDSDRDGWLDGGKTRRPASFRADFMAISAPNPT